MKIALVLTAAAVVAAIAVVVFKTLPHEPTAANTAAKQVETDAADAAAKLSAQVDGLSSTRCAEPVRALLAQDAAMPIKSLAEIPTKLRQDMSLCFERSLVSAYDRDRLFDADVLKLFPDS